MEKGEEGDKCGPTRGECAEKLYCKMESGEDDGTCQKELLEKGETCKTTEDCKAGLRCAISSSSNCKDNGYNANDEECEICGKNEGECDDGLTCSSGVCAK